MRFFSLLSVLSVLLLPLASEAGRRIGGLGPGPYGDRLPGGNSQQALCDGVYEGTWLLGGGQPMLIQLEREYRSELKVSILGTSAAGSYSATCERAPYGAVEISFGNPRARSRLHIDSNGIASGEVDGIRFLGSRQ
jgi:hypothetical protein